MFFETDNLTGEEITFSFCATSKRNDCTVLHQTTVLYTLDITFNRIPTQFAEIHMDGAILQTS